MKTFEKLESLGFFEWLKEKGFGVGFTAMILDNQPVDSIERTGYNAIAFRWFREKYNLVIEPCVPFQRLHSTEDDHFEILEFGYRIYSFDQYRGGLRDKVEWDGYDNSNEEEAELACLDKLLEIVESKSE